MASKGMGRFFRSSTRETRARPRSDDIYASLLVEAAGLELGRPRCTVCTGGPCLFRGKQVQCQLKSADSPPDSPTRPTVPISPRPPNHPGPPPRMPSSMAAKQAWRRFQASVTTRRRTTASSPDAAEPLMAVRRGYVNSQWPLCLAISPGRLCEHKSRVAVHYATLLPQAYHARRAEPRESSFIRRLAHVCPCLPLSTLCCTCLADYSWITR